MSTYGGNSNPRWPQNLNAVMAADEEEDENDEFEPQP